MVKQVKKQAKPQTAKPQTGEPGQAFKRPKLKLKKDALSKAVRALLQVVSKQNATKNDLFGDGDQTMTMIFNLSYVPTKRTMKPSLIPLPNPMYGPKSEICFISKDPQKTYKELLLEKHPVPGLTKVLGLEKLRKQYNTEKDMCALADAFDLFLVDAGILSMMRTVLGKTVYEKKKKIPIAVHLTQDPTKAIKNAIDGTPLRVPTGPCVGVKIGRCGMGQEELVANALAVIKGVLTNVRDNPIQTISVQATGTPALPVWRRPPVEKPDGGNVTSSASETAGSASEISASEAEYQELPSDAGETISSAAHTSVSEADTGSELESSALDAESGDVDISEDATVSADMPLKKGLTKNKRKRQGKAEEAAPAASEMAPPPAVKKKAKAGAK